MELKPCPFCDGKSLNDVIIHDNGCFILKLIYQSPVEEVEKAWQVRATDPLLKEMAKAIHYPQCWDTAAYPALEDALREVYASFKCSECEGNEELLKEMAEALERINSVVEDDRDNGVWVRMLSRDALKKYKEQYETNTK